ncbi:MAG: Ig-like domain-containing protein [Chloroflexota bacterium]
MKMQQCLAVTMVSFSLFAVLLFAFNNPSEALASNQDNSSLMQADPTIILPLSRKTQSEPTSDQQSRPRFLAQTMVYTLTPTKDNTLYEDVSGALSNGVGQYMFAGRVGGAGGNTLRRGVVAFDVDNTIPAGSTILSATLQLNMSKSAGGTNDVTLHKLLADWGEGSSDAGQVKPGEGIGGPASVNDATWTFSFFTSTTWMATGGDFNAIESASQSVAGSGSYSWQSAGMVADVQNWLDNAATDYGWLIKGDEAGGATSKRFGTRESPTESNRPMLIITVQLPPSNTVDLSITKTASPETVSVGDDITYTLNYANLGDVTATNVMISDFLVTSLDPVTVSGDLAYTPTNATICCSWHIQNLAPQQSGTLIVRGKIDDYTPAGLIINQVSITGTITDTNTSNNSDTALVTVVNSPPNAKDDLATVDEDMGVTILALDNDSDPNGDMLSIQSIGTPTQGTATIIASSVVVYTPSLNYAGSDNFTYSISDGVANDTATITVTINPINDPPIANDDVGSTPKDTPVTVSVLDNDTDPEMDGLTVLAVGAASNGLATTNGTVVIYTPTTSFSGTDSFSYTLSDGVLSDSAIVTITVNEVNNAPIALDDIAVTLEDTTIAIAVLNNDQDSDGHSLTVSTVGQPDNGSTAIQTDTVVYTPPNGFTGQTSFTYTVSDGALFDTGLVTVSVIAGDQTVIVDPAMSTTVTYTNSESQNSITLTLEIPANAISETTLLVYALVQTSTNEAPTGFEFVGPSFTLAGYQNGAAQSDFDFNQPVTLIVTYDPTELEGINVETLTLLFWNEDTQMWSSDGITIIDHDLVNHRLTVTIDHLTEFGLFGEEHKLFLPTVLR